MIARAPTIGWALLTAAAIVAAAGSLMVQLGFAVLAVGVVGMAHGASDLAIVPRNSRPTFLIAYVAVSALCLAWWITDPAVALPLFLVGSAVHFAMEDAPGGSWLERILRGASLVATPATLHRHALQHLLALASGSDTVPTDAVGALAAIGGIAAIVLLSVGIRRRDARLIAGTTALLLLPPLVGFALGFLILHAIPQTVNRQRHIGAATIPAYLRATAPILLAAALVSGMVAAILIRVDPSGVRALFAAIAALAMPHLLVTPWFSSDRVPRGTHSPRPTLKIAIDSPSQYH